MVSFTLAASMLRNFVAGHRQVHIYAFESADGHKNGFVDSKLPNLYSFIACSSHGFAHPYSLGQSGSTRMRCGCRIESETLTRCLIYLRESG